MTRLREWSGVTPRSKGRVDHSGLSDGRVQLAFGMLPDGSMAHVKAVPNGKACDCVCAACRRPLVAYHPESIAHHFKHAAKAKRACRYAPESAMHRYAKQLLEKEKRLFLPNLSVEASGREKVVIGEQWYGFDLVRLEEHLDTIVPDVILTKSGRDLYVEIAVTHHCDDEKIQKIEARGVSTIEIDLSQYEYTDDKEALDEVILRRAPRRWVYHRNADSAEQELLEEIEKVKALAFERKRARVMDVVRSVVQWRDGDWRGNQFHKTCVEAGLQKYIGARIVGDNCFRVSPVLWQSMVLARWVLPAVEKRNLHRHSIDLFEVARWLAGSQAIQKGLRVAPDAEEIEIYKAHIPEFRAPLDVVCDYMKKLEKQGVVVGSAIPNYWSVSFNFPFVLENAREEVRQRVANAERLEWAIDGLRLTVLDIDADFDFEKWKRLRHVEFDSSFYEAVNDLRRFPRMISALEDVVHMIVQRRAVPANLLCLPLEQVALAIADDIEERRQKTLREHAEKLRLAAVARVDGVRRLAAQSIRDAASWLSQTRNTFGGKTALEYAEESNDAAARVEHAIHLEQVDQRRANEAALDAAYKKQEYQQKLELIARRELGPTYASIFLNSSSQGLGYRKPIEYCIDEGTFQACLLVMPKVKKKK